MDGKRVCLMLVVSALLLTSGCISTPPGTAPEPNNPAGDLLDAASAIRICEDYINSLYDGSSVIVPFTVATKLESGPCAWNGTDCGNSTRWMMFFEGVRLELGVYRHINVAVQARYKDGTVNTSYAKPQVTVIAQSDVNKTVYEIYNRILEPYAATHSHAIFLAADAQRAPAPSNAYLQSVSLVLNHNSSSPIAGKAVWTVKYRYYTRDDFTPMDAAVLVDAADGKVLRVDPAK